MITARRLSSGSKLAVGYSLAMLCCRDINVVLYTSCHGELEHSYRILHVLATEQALSLIDFILSVYNPAVGNLVTAVREPTISSSLSAGRDMFQQGLCEVIGPLQARYQRVLVVDFDGFLSELYHPQLPSGMSIWSFAVALVIESGDS